MDEDLILEMFAQLALALDYMHMKRVISKNLCAKHIYLKTEGDSKKPTLKIGSFSNATVV